MKRYALFILASIIPFIASSNDSINLPDAQAFDQALPQINPAPTVTSPSRNITPPASSYGQNNSNSNNSHSSSLDNSPVASVSPQPYSPPLPSASSTTPVTPTTPSLPQSSPAPQSPKGNSAQPNTSTGYQGGLFLGGKANHETDSQAKEFMIY